MTAKQYETALVSYGIWQKNIARKIKGRSDVRVKYICDSRPEQLALATADFPSAITTVDYKKIGPVDVVIDATDPKYHFPINMHFLQQGSHLFATKPIAITEDGINAIAKEQLRRGNKIGIDFQETYVTGIISKMIQKYFSNQKLLKVHDYRMIKDPHSAKRLLQTTIFEDVPHIHFVGLMQWLYGVDSESIRNTSYSVDGISAEFTCNNGQIECNVETRWVEPGAEATIEKRIEFEFDNGNMSVVDVPYPDGTSELLFDGNINERVKVPDKLGLIVNDFFDSLSQEREPVASLSKPEIRKIHLDTLHTVTPEFLRKK